MFASKNGKKGNEDSSDILERALKNSFGWLSTEYKVKKTLEKLGKEYLKAVMAQNTKWETAKIPSKAIR